MENQKNILIIGSVAESLKSFRGDFIKELVSIGFNVYAAAPKFKSNFEEQIEELGARPVTYYLQRSGLNPAKDIKTILSLRKVIKENDINLIFPYTIKPVVYGSIAASTLKIPTISLITGLGYTFSSSSTKAKMLEKVTSILYRLALKDNETIIFQNVDDYKLFIKKGIIRKSKKYRIVSGSGINLNRFKFRRKVNPEEIVKFVFVARFIREKGIHLFIEAAKALKSIYPKSEYHIVGSIPEGSPSSIDANILKHESNNGTIINHGWVNDISSVLESCHVFVLPTYYREGIPRSILEALSIGMPVITTNTPGCKETVIKNFNGILVKPKDLDDLKNALEFFILNPSEIAVMSLNSRRYAEERFDVKLVNEDLIDEIKKVL